MSRQQLLLEESKKAQEATDIIARRSREEIPTVAPAAPVASVSQSAEFTQLTLLLGQQQHAVQRLEQVLTTKLLDAEQVIATL